MTNLVNHTEIKDAQETSKPDRHEDPPSEFNIEAQQMRKKSSEPNVSKATDNLIHEDDNSTIKEKQCENVSKKSLEEGQQAPNFSIKSDLDTNVDEAKCGRALDNVIGNTAALSVRNQDNSSIVSSSDVAKSASFSRYDSDSVNGVTAHNVDYTRDMLSNNVGTITEMTSTSACPVDALTSRDVGEITSESAVSVNNMTSHNVDSASDVVSSRTTQSTSTVVSPIDRHDSVAGQKKRKRRGSAWSDEQTEFLMEIWARHAEQKEDDTNHSTPVYRLIAKSMEEHGNLKTWEQCKTRIHTLKRAYKLTRDEIKAGATNITYCRHFDKLEIIMGENDSTTPQMLADLLELRRKQNRENLVCMQTPLKRKITQSDKCTKRAHVQGSDKNPPTPQYHQSQQVDSVTPVDPTMSNNYLSTSQQPQQGQQLQNLQQTSPQQQESSTPTFQLSWNLNSYPSPPLPPPPPYQPMTATNMNYNHARGTTSEINNNEIVIKREQQITDGTNDNISTMTAQTWVAPHTHHKEELEKMRLDLELRKIEMERNKLEMEERQRREERDHQYRMLQLLLFGLGQQSSAHVLPGQAAEQVVQAQNSTNLSRALENGLVPGGPRTANEKGLSFNEI